MTAGAVDRTCAACGERVGLDPCPRCGASTLLDGRYVLRSVLGKGAQATTWLAETLDGRRVAIKELRVDADDKTRELVTREARVLKQIVVPNVPRYIDEFATPSGRQRLVCVVQEYVAGPTLEAFARDYRFTVDEAVAHVDALLGILAELHALSPPVIHRDVKPANVILRDGERVTLVDFGSVRDVWKGTLGGSTVTGTFGYMPPEQFAGDASPASDVYAAAVVLVVLLSRKDPAAMLGAERTITWRPHLDVDDALGRWLDRCLHADAAHRPVNASIARAELVVARTERDAPPAAPVPTWAPPNAAHTRLPQALEAGPRVLTADREPVVDPIPRLPAQAGPAPHLSARPQRLLYVIPAISAVIVTCTSIIPLCVAMVMSFSVLLRATPPLVRELTPPPAVTVPATDLGKVVAAVDASDATSCLGAGELWRGELEFTPETTVTGPDGPSTTCVAARLGAHKIDVADPKRRILVLANSADEGDVSIARNPRFDGPHLVLQVVSDAQPLDVSASGVDARFDGPRSFTVDNIPVGTYTFSAGPLHGEVDLTGSACTVQVVNGAWTANCVGAP